jgi:hypothetical protein
MAIVTKDISAVVSKWSQRAQAAGTDYGAGVKSPRRDWAQNTAASADSWAQGVTDAVANGRFARGVNAAGTPKWQTGATTKGVTRYPQGVAAGGPNYNAGFSPYLSVISGLNLTPRGPRGSPANVQRVQIIADALHRKKVGG